MKLAFSCVAMSNQLPFRYFKTSLEIVQLAVMLYVRFLLSLRLVEDRFEVPLDLQTFCLVILEAKEDANVRANSLLR